MLPTTTATRPWACPTMRAWTDEMTPNQDEDLFTTQDYMPEDKG